MSNKHTKNYERAQRQIAERATNRNTLASALFDVITEAPAEQQAALHVAFNDFAERYTNTVRRASPLLRALLDAIDEATDLVVDDEDLASDDDAGATRRPTYKLIRLSNGKEIHNGDFVKHKVLAGRWKVRRTNEVVLIYKGGGAHGANVTNLEYIGAKLIVIDDETTS